MAKGSLSIGFPSLTKPLILHVRATNFYGGPEKQIFEHIRRSRNYRHAVVTFVDSAAGTELSEKCRVAGIQVHAIGPGQQFIPLAIRRLRQIIASLRPSMICSHGYKPAILLPIAAIGRKIPILGFARGFTAENTKVAFFEFLERRAMGRFYGVVCVCKAQQQQLTEAGIRAKRFWVVQNAVSLPDKSAESETSAHLRRDLGLSPDITLIICAGRLSPEKGQSDLLRAISMLSIGIARYRLLICGDGPLRTVLEREASSLGIADRVRFLGFRRDLMTIFQSMNLLVLPSHTEGLPNVILEAFSCAKPVVATSVGGIPELVVHGKNGLLVPPKRPDLLSRALESCLASPEKTHLMGKEGFSTVSEQFSFEAHTRRLEKIYEEVLASANLM